MDTLTGSTYFHSTLRPHWKDTVLSEGIWIHAGSIESAIQRAARVTQGGVLKVLEPHHLWKVMVNKKMLRMPPFRIADMDDNWEALDHKDFDAYEYINEHELSHDISIYVNSHFIAEIEYVAIIKPGRLDLRYPPF